MHDANPLKFVGRRLYAWAMVAGFVVAPALEIAIFQLFPSTERYGRYINTTVFVCIVLLTGSRLADAGYPRWIGITVMLVIGAGIPAAAGLAYRPWFNQQMSWEVFAVGLIGIVMSLSLAFVVWAGTRKSVSHEHIGTGSRRIEPHF